MVPPAPRGFLWRTAAQQRDACRTFGAQVSGDVDLHRVVGVQEGSVNLVVIRYILKTSSDPTCYHDFARTDTCTNVGQRHTGSDAKKARTLQEGHSEMES